jgi:hypothetical protein
MKRAKLMTEPSSEKPGSQETWRDVGRNALGILLLAVTSVPVLWFVFWLSAPAVPTFGRDLPFPQAIAEEFPEGTPLQTFALGLEDAGFADIRVSPDGRLGQATLNRLLLFCQDIYIVSWEAAADGTLARLEGQELPGC